MLEWMKKRGSPARDKAKADADADANANADADADATRRRGYNKAGKYRWLYEYLEKRYANTVVLTFGQVEDLLGFALPDLARTDQEWWTSADISTAEARWSDAWRLASRTATPNLMAQTVTFERVS